MVWTPPPPIHNIVLTIKTKLCVDTFVFPASSRLCEEIEDYVDWFYCVFYWDISQAVNKDKDS